MTLDPTLQAILRHLEESPLVRRMRAEEADRTGFQTVGRVEVLDPEFLWEARCWLMEKWDTERRPFRPTRHAAFEFADVAHAVEFKLRFCGA